MLIGRPYSHIYHSYPYLFLIVVAILILIVGLIDFDIISLRLRNNMTDECFDGDFCQL